MQREDVPQENWLVNLGQNFPDDGCRTLGDRRTFRCARQRQTTVYLAEGLKVYFIGEWKPGSPSTPVTQIAGYPNGVNTFLKGYLNNGKKIGAPPLRSICPIMQCAPVAVGVKNVLKADSSKGINEGSRFHVFIFSNVMVRLVRSATIVPPRCLRSCRNTS